MRTRGRLRIGAAARMVVAAVPLLGIALGAAGSAAVAQPTPTGDAEEPARIAFLLDGPDPAEAELADAIRREIRTLVAGDLAVEMPPELTLAADHGVADAGRLLDRLFADRRVDLVVAVGPLASHALCCREPLSKPAVAAVVIDAPIQGFPRLDGGSGRTNLTYVALPDPLLVDLRTFRDLASVERVAILVPEALLDALPGVAQRLETTGRAVGLALTLVPVGGDVQRALANLPDDIDGVYLAPLAHLDDESIAALHRGLIERGLPSFAFQARSEAERTALAFARSTDLDARLARRIALDVQRILLGESAAALPVGFPDRRRLFLNLRTARALEFSPSWRTLVEAELLHEDDAPKSETLSLTDAVARAVAENLDLVARRRAVAAGEREVSRARALLLPSVDIGFLGLGIDDDRAAASLGSQAERSLSGSLGLEQILYSDAVLANLAIQRRLQEGRERDLEALRLDIAREAAAAYLDVLRARSLVRVRRGNLDLTRSHLELSRTRRRVGAGNPAEVYRWESQSALDRKALVEAMAVRRVAEMALARLLHRDVEQVFVTVEPAEEPPPVLLRAETFGRLVQNEHGFRRLRDLLVSIALERSPELRRIDALEAAAERRAKAARRAYWAPTLGLQATFDELLSESGAGSSGPALPPGLSLPTADDSSWSVALQASLPLFSGGERSAERAQADLELERVRLEGSAVSERVDQAVRSALVVARSSFAGIELSREAATAAAQNLELLTDAYARGAVSVLDLLDAQNASLSADELSVNSLYDFAVDLVDVARAAGLVDVILDPAEGRALARRLEEAAERLEQEEG